MRSPDREVIPTVLNPGDVCSQDEAIFTPGSSELAQRYAGFAGDDASWDVAERAFHAASLDVLAGRRAWRDPEWLALAHALRIDGPRHHDTRPGRIADVRVPDEVLCDIVEDAVPELLMLLERVTGVEGMPARPPIGAIAALGFLNCGIEGTRPIDGWMDDEEDRALVQSVRVVNDAPVGVWQDGVCLVPMLPKLRPPPEAFGSTIPTGPELSHVGSHAERQAFVDLPRRFVGRAYQTRTGWAFSGVLTLPAGGTAEEIAAVLERRMTLELWQIRRGEPRSTFEDALRHRPEVVYRTAMEAALWFGERDAGIRAST